MPTVTRKAVDGEWIADAVYGPRQKRSRLARQLNDRFLGVPEFFICGLGQVEQHQHREIAYLAHNADVNTRVRRLAHADVNHGADRGVKINLVAVFLAAYALYAFRLHGVDDVPQARGHGPVIGEYAVDVRGITPLLTLFQHRHPVGAMQLHRIVPFLIVIGL